MKKGAFLWAGALFSLLVLVFSLSAVRRDRVQAVRPAEPTTASAPNGAALLYVPGPFHTDYEVTAEMSLPRVAANRSWYSVWLMLVEFREDRPEPPFIQGGLMRWERKHFDLTAFTADASLEQSLIYGDVGDLSEGRHRVTLRGNASVVDLIVDGKRLRRFDRRRLLGDAPRVYVQIGGELNAPGDTLDATVRSVTVKRDTDARPHPETIACWRYDRGLRFDNGAEGVFRATGTFDVNRPSGYRKCQNFASWQSKDRSKDRVRDRASR